MLLKLQFLDIPNKNLAHTFDKFRICPNCLMKVYEKFAALLQRLFFGGPFPILILSIPSCC